MSSHKLYRERTSLRTLVVALSALLTGVFLLFISETWQWLQSVPPVQAVVRDLGALLVSTVTIATLWELAAKRAFLAELMAQARLAEEIRSAGIVTVTTDFQRGIDWKKMFKTVKKLDIFFSYGRTWRGTNLAELNELAQRPGTRVRVVLPDPYNDELMKELGRRFRKAPDEVSKLILEASDDFQNIFKDSDFSLWFLSESPAFSFYRFDHQAILALFKHGKRGGSLPTFIVEKGGTVYDFIRREFDAFIQEPGGMARKIFPRP
jgi:hypothetical protein